MRGVGAVAHAAATLVDVDEVQSTLYSRPPYGPNALNRGGD